MYRCAPLAFGETGSDRGNCGRRLRVPLNTWLALIVGAVALSAVAGLGCHRPGGVQPGDRQVASPHPFSDDIPVPAGFALEERTGTQASDGSDRVERHRYAGKADKRAVRDFYIREMPLVRWSLSADAVVHGRYTLVFDRGDRRCTVVIHGSDGGWFRSTYVDVTMSPCGDLKEE